MRVTVDVKGEGSQEIDLDDPTAADLLREVGLSPHEATVLVDGRPVPNDRRVEADRVTVLRLIEGG